MDRNSEEPVFKGQVGIEAKLMKDINQQIKDTERLHGPPRPQGYWQPVKDVWNLYNRTEKWVLVGGWVFGLIMALFLVRAIW